MERDRYRDTTWAIFGTIAVIALALALWAGRGSDTREVATDCEWSWHVHGGDVRTLPGDGSRAEVACRDASVGGGCVVRAECR